MKLSRSEAGKLGAIATGIKLKQEKEDRIVLYNTNPKHCRHCVTPLPYTKRSNIYCSNSCSASDLTKSRKSRKKKFFNCLNCGIDSGRNPKYCSSKCNLEYEYKITEQKILAGKGSSTQIKQYLIMKNGLRCEKCNETHKLGEIIPIEIDHINGDHKDNRLENCRLLCPTCHAMTPTYKNRNRGRGRHSRRQRYKEGKSY
jgi:predicted nucleic acid-binding Zn ribbon protein